MGILDGMMAGLGAGVAQAGNTMVTGAIRAEEQERGHQNQMSAMQMQDGLAVKRAEALERLKMSLGEEQRVANQDRIRGQVGGIVGKHWDDVEGDYEKAGTLNDTTREHLKQQREGAIQDAMRDPKTLQSAYLADGDLDSARKLEGVGDGKMHNVGTGQSVIDENGRVIYDDQMKEKSRIENDRTGIMRERMYRAGTGSIKADKPIDPDRVIPLARRAAEVYTKGRKNPYMDDQSDTVYNDLLDGVVQKIALSGDSAHQGAQEAHKALSAYDTKVQQYADALGESMFDKKGKLIREDMAAGFTQSGLKTSSLFDFKASVRDSLLTEEQFLRFSGNPKVEAKRLDAMARKYKATGKK